MNIGIICNINDNKPIGVIGIEDSGGEVDFITQSEKLNSAISIILEQDKIKMPIKEGLEQNEIIRNKYVTSNTPHYLSGINYNLPRPWRILGVRYLKGTLQDQLKKMYDEINQLE
jgi:hypothetical protein